MGAFFMLILTLSVLMMKNNRENEGIVSNNERLEDELWAEEADATLPPEETDASEEVFMGHDFDFVAEPSETDFAEPADYDNPIAEDENADFNTYEADYTPETEAPATTAATTSRTVITSRQRKDYDSNSVYLDMENILQNPELPVGCEITALTILLRHYGFDAQKTDLAKNYLPVSWGNARYEDGKTYKDSFYDYFIGDPFSRGYGCFSPAIEKAANKYIAAHGGGYRVKNISGCHPDTLYEYLIAGTPVLCWATDGMIEPEYYETWYDNDTGEQLDWYLNEHCFVLAGFNISASTVTLNDPMKGIIDYNIDKFEVRFKQMHSQALVLIPENAPEAETTAAVTEAPREEQTESETAVQETAVTEETAPETSEIVTEETSEIVTETELTYEVQTEGGFYDPGANYFGGE